ncbi:hypothetical protein CHS0354_039563, partial [Potamilus streckersoni]
MPCNTSLYKHRSVSVQVYALQYKSMPVQVYANTGLCPAIYALQYKSIPVQVYASTDLCLAVQFHTSRSLSPTVNVHE